MPVSLYTVFPFWYYYWLSSAAYHCFSLFGQASALCQTSAMCACIYLITVLRMWLVWCSPIIACHLCACRLTYYNIQSARCVCMTTTACWRQTLLFVPAYHHINHFHFIPFSSPHSLVVLTVLITLYLTWSSVHETRGWVRRGYYIFSRVPWPACPNACIIHYYSCLV